MIGLESLVTTEIGGSGGLYLIPLSHAMEDGVGDL